MNRLQLLLLRLLKKEATRIQLLKRQFSTPVAAAGSGDDSSPYDMVIAGGGMVGSALACCIGESNLA